MASSSLLVLDRGLHTPGTCVYRHEDAAKTHTIHLWFALNGDPPRREEADPVNDSYVRVTQKSTGVSVRLPSPHNTGRGGVPFSLAPSDELWVAASAPGRIVAWVVAG